MKRAGSGILGKREKRNSRRTDECERALGNASSALRRLLSIKPSSPFLSFYFPPRPRRLSFRFPFCTLLPLLSHPPTCHNYNRRNALTRDTPRPMPFLPGGCVFLVATKSRKIARTRKRKGLRNRNHS